MRIIDGTRIAIVVCEPSSEVAAARRRRGQQHTRTFSFCMICCFLKTFMA